MHLKKIGRIVSLLLCAALLLTALSVSAVADEGEPEPGVEKSSAITAKQLKLIAKDYDVSAEFLEELAGQKSITEKELKRYAKTYGLPAQYVQRFVKDSFVFKEGNALRYDPIMSGVPKHGYDWSNLTHTAKEIKYTADGVLKAQKGIDVSEFQGAIDWKKVKADGVKVAFIRVGYRGYSSGKLVEDKYFHQNMKGALNAGVKVGAYFYSQAISVAEARQEAKFVVDRLADYRVTYPVAFDFEGAPSASARTRNLMPQKATPIIKAFCDAVESAGYHPMIYSYTKYFVEKMDVSKLKKYDKWLAQYYKEPFFPYEFQIWQYSSTGRVSGIKGGVDMNLIFSGS